MFFGAVILPSMTVLNILAIALDIRSQQSELAPGIVEQQQECCPEKTIETRHVDASHHGPRMYRAAHQDGDKDGDVLPS